VFCVFIYDKEVLDTLPHADRRVAFIHACIAELAAELQQMGGGLIVRQAQAREAIPRLAAALAAAGRPLFTGKDQEVFEKHKVLSQSGTPFPVFTYSTPTVLHAACWANRLSIAPSSTGSWNGLPKYAFTPSCIA